MIISIRRLMIWMMAGSASRADATLPQTLAGRCWRSWDPFFTIFEDQKGSSSTPSRQRITPGTCSMPAKLGCESCLFHNFPRPKRQLPHPQRAKHHPRHLQDDAGEAGDAKAAFFADIRRPKQLLHPQHAKHHPGHLQDDAGEAGDAKAAFSCLFLNIKKTAPTSAACRAPPRAPAGGCW